MENVAGGQGLSLQYGNFFHEKSFFFVQIFFKTLSRHKIVFFQVRVLKLGHLYLFRQAFFNSHGP